MNLARSRHRRSRCVVAAYVSPESDRSKIDALVKRLRDECGAGAETKLGQISEARYIEFLRDLKSLRGIAFASAVDVSLHTRESVLAHQQAQADKVIEHVDTMLYESGKHGVRALGDSLRSLPFQLYTQLQCQIELFHNVLTRAPLYYCQRHPPTLGHLRWRVDRKDTIPTAYESAFRTILPAVLQSKSLRDPMIMLKEGDYRFFNRFNFPPGEQPDYLKTQYGIDIGDDGANVGQMVGEDFRLVDSNIVPGVQVADLLAAGVRRVMRGHFDDPLAVARMIGANLVGGYRNEPAVQLVSLAGPGDVSPRTTDILHLMKSSSKPMLVM